MDKLTNDKNKLEEQLNEKNQQYMELLSTKDSLVQQVSTLTSKIDMLHEQVSCDAKY